MIDFNPLTGWFDDKGSAGMTASSVATFANKTFDTAGTGNSLLVNGVAVTANTGTGAVVRAQNPTFTEKAIVPSTNISTANAEGYHVKNAGGQTIAAFQGLDFAGYSFVFFAVNKLYLGNAWADSGLSRVGASFQITNDGFTFFSFDTGNTFTDRFAIAAGTFNLVFNETGADADARFEGDTDANLLFTDASMDRVGIGTATPRTKLEVAGVISAWQGASSALAKLGGIIFDHYIDATNTNATETDLYTDTLTAAALGANGDKLRAQYGGVFVGDATSTQRLKMYFGGTLIFDSGALGIGVLGASWNLNASLIRVSSSIVRCSVSLNTSFATLNAYATYTEVTGLTLANTQIIKITGTAAGATGASNQVTAKEGLIEWLPAA